MVAVIFDFLEEQGDQVGRSLDSARIVDGHLKDVEMMDKPPLETLGSGSVKSAPGSIALETVGETLVEFHALSEYASVTW